MLFAKWVKEKKGQALVEFALVLPILLMLVLGIAEFGHLLNAHMVISNASREGARQAAVGFSKADVETIAKTQSNTLGPENITATAAYKDKTSDGKSNGIGDEVTVTVVYNVKTITPLYNFLTKTIPSIDDETTMRIEYER